MKISPKDYENALWGTKYSRNPPNPLNISSARVHRRDSGHKHPQAVRPRRGARLPRHVPKGLPHRAQDIRCQIPATRWRASHRGLERTGVLLGGQRSGQRRWGHLYSVVGDLFFITGYFQNNRSLLSISIHSSSIIFYCSYFCKGRWEIWFLCLFVTFLWLVC